MERKRGDEGWRSVVIAPEAMVATSQPLAVQVGIDILKKGGPPSMPRSLRAPCSAWSNR